MVFLLSPKLPPRLLVAATLVAIWCRARRRWPQATMFRSSSTRRRSFGLIGRPLEIVVGNPSIADVSVQSGKVLVVTGKSFGETNLIVMDADGKVVVNRQLIVQEPRTGFVTMYRGPRTADLTLRAVLHAAARYRRQ